MFKLPKLVSADFSPTGSWESVSNEPKSGAGSVVNTEVTGGADCDRVTSVTSATLTCGSGVNGCDNPDNPGDIVK